LVVWGLILPMGFSFAVGSPIRREIASHSVRRLPAHYPDHVIGPHLIHPPYRSDDDLGPTELAYLESLARYDQSDAGYSEIMLTRPDTIAAALIDSPVGLAARIINKLHDWVDHDGNLEDRISCTSRANLPTASAFCEALMPSQLHSDLNWGVPAVASCHRTTARRRARPGELQSQPQRRLRARGSVRVPPLLQ